MLRSFKKAGLLVGILCVAITIQGCDIAAIMSSVGGIIAGLGQAFGGPTGQVLGQVGQLLGGVGQAFGQQQAGVAGALAGAAGPLGGQNLPGGFPNPLGGLTNPAQNPLGALFPPGGTPGTGIVGLPQAPGQQQVQQVIAILNRQPPGQLTPQRVAAAAQQLGITDPTQLQALTGAVLTQIAQAQGQQQLPQPPQVPGPFTPPFSPGPFTPPFFPGQGAPPQFPGNLAGGNPFQGALAAAQAAINLVNVFRGNTGQRQPLQPPPVVAPPVVPPRPPPTFPGIPPGANILFA